jgi:hypothetical protein
MAIFHVEIREVHVSTRAVEADSAEEAIRKVKDCEELEEISCEYSHTLDSETWQVNDAESGETVRDQYPNGIPGIPGS